MSSIANMPVRAALRLWVCTSIAFAGFVLSGSMPNQAQAACLLPNNVALTVNFPDYKFWRSVAEQMQQCGNVEAKFEFDAASVEVDAALPDRNLGSLVGISNASLNRLMKQNLLRPLDDLANKYRTLIHPRQLIRVDGKVMAIAVAANTRALMVHRELFTQEGIDIPKTYADLIAAARRLPKSQLYETPLTLAFEPGWNLTQQFIDLFMAAGGTPFNDEGNPDVAGDAGVKAIETLRALAEFLPADADEKDTPGVLDDLLRFKAPMSVTWISSAGPLDNPGISRVSGKMQVFPAPAIETGGKPASTLWWDGFAIPVSATREEAEAAFVTALEGLDEDMLQEHRGEAMWLVADYEPVRLTTEVMKAIDDGIPIYPDSLEMSLLRRALNEPIAQAVRGETEPLAALNEAVEAYQKAAQESGL